MHGEITLIFTGIDTQPRQMVCVETKLLSLVFNPALAVSVFWLWQTLGLVSCTYMHMCLISNRHLQCNANWSGMGWVFARVGSWLVCRDTPPDTWCRTSVSACRLTPISTAHFHVLVEKPRTESGEAAAISPAVAAEPKAASIQDAGTIQVIHFR